MLSLLLGTIFAFIGGIFLEIGYATRESSPTKGWISIWIGIVLVIHCGMQIENSTQEKEVRNNVAEQTDV